MLKKIIFLIIILSLLNSCLLIKIDKDSAPLIDCGAPLIGHFRNGDITKGILYTVLFATSLIGIILFSPSQTQGYESKSIIPIERNISDPIFYSFIGTTGSIFIGSSIDTAVTYQLANKKIIELNEIELDAKLKKSKYQVIIEYREEQEKIKEKQQHEVYKKEIEYYRERLIDGTITEDELLFLKRVPEIMESLEKELGYYYINKELKKE